MQARCAAPACCCSPWPRRGRVPAPPPCAGRRGPGPRTRRATRGSSSPSGGTRDARLRARGVLVAGADAVRRRVRQGPRACWASRPSPTSTGDGGRRRGGGGGGAHTARGRRGDAPNRADGRGRRGAYRRRASRPRTQCGSRGLCDALASRPAVRGEAACALSDACRAAARALRVVPLRRRGLCVFDGRRRRGRRVPRARGRGPGKSSRSSRSERLVIICTAPRPRAGSATRRARATFLTSTAARSSRCGPWRHPGPSRRR